MEDVVRNNPIPGIFASMSENKNIIISSPTSEYQIQFEQTRETLLDPEVYKNFLKNAIKRFRTSVTYDHYKSYLMGLGMDRCQVLGNINSDMATIEMHHNMINIFELSIIICENTIRTNGKITTFDLTHALKVEHTQNHIQLVMLSKTPHQLYHNTDELFIHPSMCIGDWATFLEIYHWGITRNIALKIIYYLKRAEEFGGTDTGEILKLRERVEDWSEKNLNIFGY